MHLLELRPAEAGTPTLKLVTFGTSPTEIERLILLRTEEQKKRQFIALKIRVNTNRLAAQPNAIYFPKFTLPLGGSRTRHDDEGGIRSRNIRNLTLPAGSYLAIDPSADMSKSMRCSIVIAVLSRYSYSYSTGSFPVRLRKRAPFH
jgi:hypothetical protein